MRKHGTDSIDRDEETETRGNGKVSRSTNESAVLLVYIALINNPRAPNSAACMLSLSQRRQSGIQVGVTCLAVLISIS